MNVYFLNNTYHIEDRSVQGNSMSGADVLINTALLVPWFAPASIDII